MLYVGGLRCRFHPLQHPVRAAAHLHRHGSAATSQKQIDHSKHNEPWVGAASPDPKSFQRKGRLRSVRRHERTCRWSLQQRCATTRSRMLGSLWTPTLNVRWSPSSSRRMMIWWQRQSVTRCRICGTTSEGTRAYGCPLSRFFFSHCSGACTQARIRSQKPTPEPTQSILG